MEYLVLVLLVCVGLGLLFVAISSLVSVIGGAQFVRTPSALYPAILELASLTQEETFLELGSGQGQLLAYIAQYSKARVIGIELAPLLVLQSRWLTRHLPQVRVSWQHLMSADYSRTDVIYCYLLPQTLKRLLPDLTKQLHHGSRVVSYAFPLPNLTPTKTIPRTKVSAPLYLYEF